MKLPERVSLPLSHWKFQFEPPTVPLISAVTVLEPLTLRIAGESVVAPCRHALFDLDVVDARPARPLAKGALEAIERVGVALGEGLDVAIRQVAHPAVDALALGGLDGEIAEADSLHAAGDQKAPGDAHGG